MQARYWWPGLDQDVTEVLETFYQCAQFQRCRSVTRLQPIETQYIFELVIIDTRHVTLPSGRNKYFLMAVNSFTKWAELCAVGSETGITIAQFLREEVIKRHVCPERAPHRK